MDFLVFQLRAPLSSWGDVAVGQVRGSADRPSQSALIGLMGAALGIVREDEASHAALRDQNGFAVGLLSEGLLLRDYHTTQVPTAVGLKRRPHATRRHELQVEKSQMGTILSTRDYRQGGASLVAIAVRSGVVPKFTLDTIAQALRTPHFTLCLGRKSCPPSAPLWPKVIGADSAKAAFEVYAAQHEVARQVFKTHRGTPLVAALAPLSRLYFDDHIPAGAPVLMTTVRKDRLINRKAWQFGDRREHLADLGNGAEDLDLPSDAALVDASTLPLTLQA